MRTLGLLLLSLLALSCSQGARPDDAGADSGAGDAVSADAPASGDSGGDANACTLQATATLSGTLLGQTLAPKDAVSYQTHTTDYEAVVAITDFANACSLGNDYKASSNVLSMVYVSPTQPLSAVTFDLSKSTVWDAQYAQFDATCQSSQGESSTAGTITITSVDACGIVGSYDLTLNNDHVTGTFTAPSCANAADGGAGACK